jgi:PAS domain S-box-containing protein
MGVADIVKRASWITEVPTLDPDDARRAKLLNILLIGMFVCVSITLLMLPVVGSLGVFPVGHILQLLIASLSVLILCVVLILLNRTRFGLLARIACLLLLVCIALFVDEPEEVVSGRSIIVFSIPILVASVLIRPSASFVTAALCYGIIWVYAFALDLMADPLSIVIFIAIAVVAWLATRTMERAIHDLRTLNLELDQRVQDRTRDLAAALAREQAEASKSQAILEGIADGVIVFDNDGAAIVANPAIGRLVERPAEEITGCSIEALMGDDVDAAGREMIVDLLRNKEMHAPSVRFEWGAKTLSVSVAPVRIAPDEVTGTVAVFRDFTREAEVERMKSAFVSMVSHDLRTPLSAVIGYADMLRAAVYGQLSKQQLGVMERVNANARRLLSLVNNLLDQAQIEAGKLALRITSFAPGDLLEDLESVMGLMAQDKNLELTYHIAEDVPDTLRGDQQRLHQILVNLVNNAIKFTDKGGVSVRIYRPDADRWALEVSDTGLGISTEAQSSIFDPFWQVDDTITREHTGVGLGLTIVRQLTTLMAGEITLVSEPGHGSTLTVVLPLTPTQEESP